MQERYALRFESGERRGEIIAIRAGGLTLGRRPGNSVQILDASVSGRHAEVVVDERGALLRDLGSTNGTRVGAERIAEQRLAHGDALSVGTVRFLFIDRTVGGEPPPLELEGEVPVAAAAGSAADAVHTISADKLARAKNKRSVVVGAAALVVALGAAAAWFLWPRNSTQAGNKSRAVEAVGGNLLAAGYSFEDEAGWEAFPEAPARFLADPGAARSGKQGLRASLASGEWALERSAEVAIKSRGLLKATAWIAAEGDVAVQLGIELSSSSAAAGTTWAWTAPAPTGSGFQELVLAAPVLPGFDRVRVLVLARGSAAGGLAQIDDASLVAAGNAPEPAAKIGEFQLALLGDPARAAVLSKIDHPLITDLRVAVGEDAYGEGAPNLTVEPQETGARLRFAAAPAGGERALSLRVEPGPTAQGIATLGEGGYRTHQVEFTREGVTSLLAGSGIDLVRIVFAQPVTVSGRPEDNGFRLRAGPGGVDEALVQVVFRDERTAGEDLARAARTAEKEGRLGESLAHWKELLDRSPFENALIQEAEGARSRLIQKGMEEVAASKNEVERAQFFRLADLYRECRGRADAIAVRYQGSDVETAARELVARIDAELAVLEVDLKSAERERLRRILAVLEQGKMDQLATRVRDELARAGGGAN